MKRILMIASILLGSVSFAQRRGENEVNVNLGFEAGAVNIGAEYGHYLADTHSVGGYLFVQTEKKKDGTVLVHQTTAFGADLKVHVGPKSPVDVYLAPGFGLAMISKATADGDDKTVFGPSMRIGAQYAFTPTVKLGLERFLIVNWFDDEAPAMGEFTTLALGFSF